MRRICCQDIQAFFKIKVRKISWTKFLLEGNNVTSQSTKKKKKGQGQIFCFHTCQAPPNPTTYLIITHLFIPLASSLPHFSFLSFSPISFSVEHSLYSFKLSCRHLQINISTIIFLTKSLENCCEPISTFTSFFLR